MQKARAYKRAFGAWEARSMTQLRGHNDTATMDSKYGNYNNPLARPQCFVITGLLFQHSSLP